MSDLPVLLGIIGFTVVVAVGLTRICLQLSHKSDQLHDRLARAHDHGDQRRMA